MSRSRGTLRNRTRAFQNASLAELMGVFTPWLDLASSLGKPERHRLFSPHDDLLAFLDPGAVGRWVLPGSRTQVFGLARVDGRQGGVPQFGRVL